MIFGLLESFNESPLLLYLGVIAVACVGGGIPPMLERRRRRAIENQLPTFLEALSDSVGAGRGLQEAMMEQSESNDGLLASFGEQESALVDEFKAVSASLADLKKGQSEIKTGVDTLLQRDNHDRDLAKERGKAHPLGSRPPSMIRTK